MYRLALKMLLADRGKYWMLLGGLTFAALLMTQQSAVFFGLMNWTTSHLRNMRAPIWVVDPKVEQVNEVKALRDTDASRVRSVPGVGWAMPLFYNVQQCKLPDGNFKPVLMVGLDGTTLIGHPATILQGRLEDIRLPNCVMVDDLAIERLSAGGRRKLKIGDVFEINDKEARIVAICLADRHFFGYPYIFTTYDQALKFTPARQRMLSAIIAHPAAGVSDAQAARNITKLTGLRAFTEDEFAWATLKWYFRNTGIPFSFMTTIILGFFVGAAIAGQTFYSFVLDNLRHLGALKAMGASNGLLCRMLLLQALTVGLIGYGLGMGLTVMFGQAVLKKGQPPFMLPYQLPLGTLVVILVISTFAALLGIRRVIKIEPAIVFRG